MTCAFIYIFEKCLFVFIFVFKYVKQMCKRGYPKVFQHIFSKYKTLILRVGGEGNLKNMDFSKIIFTWFCEYTKTMHHLFKLLFDISHSSRDIPRNRKFCMFFKG